MQDNLEGYAGRHRGRPPACGSRQSGCRCRYRLGPWPGGPPTVGPPRISCPLPGRGAAPVPDALFDPLSGLREPSGPEVDLFISGPVFLDIIFTGLESVPKGGVEVWAEGMGSCPGGIANLAVAARRLGLRTSLASAFGDDD